MEVQNVPIISVSSKKLEMSNELLGSLTTDSDDPAVRIRTSARVIHNKLRMDSTPQSLPTPIETSTEISNVNQPKTPSQSKAHTRIQWTNTEKKFFFDALNEHGRDFEQISRFINTKMKRKTPTEADYKTKEHVRQHYYQLFQKASKYLRFSDDVKKLAQELYTLINFGEMKKKLIMSSEKSFLKLRDLVYRGSVTIRVKGKNIKIKTPSCRALKKLNQLEGNNYEDILLPQRIDVILRPSNLTSFTYVQRLAQNPRVKMSLPLQRRLVTLLQTMQQKWRGNDVRTHERHVGKIVQQHGRQKFPDDFLTQMEDDVSTLRDGEPQLCFYPPENCRIFRPMIQLNEMLSSYNLCLNSYEARIGARTRGEGLSMEKNAHIKELLKNSSKRVRNDSASERINNNNVIDATKKIKVVVVDDIQEDLAGIASLLDYKSNDSNDSDTKKKVFPLDEIDGSIVVEKQQQQEPEVMSSVNVGDVECKKEINENEIVKTETKGENFSIVSSKPKKSIMCGGKAHKEYSFKPLINDDALKKIREGWNVKNVNDLTVGDLYLMFGSDSKLILEYKWIDVSESNSAEQEMKIEVSPLGNKLKNLLSIASLIENPIACHNSEKSFSSDVKEGGTSDVASVSTFKQPPIAKPPYFDTYIRAPLNMNPRLKPHQSKWWRNQQLYRCRMPTEGLIPNNFKGNVGNHVIRNLYETPSTSQNASNNGNYVVEPDELTRTLEDKIQNLSKQNSDAADSSPYIQNFSESSRSSIRSLLESLSSNKSSYDYADNLATLRLWDQNNGKEPSDEIDNISLSSLLGYLDSFYDNKNQENNNSLEDEK